VKTYLRSDLSKKLKWIASIMASCHIHAFTKYTFKLNSLLLIRQNKNSLRNNASAKHSINQQTFTNAYLLVYHHKKRRNSMTYLTNIDSFSKAPQTLTHQTCPHQNQTQCQAFPWTCILCSKSLQKHDTQWSQLPLSPQHPLLVQWKQMGCTFIWNSQEKQSDSIHLQLPPTKQMDHPPTIPNAKHSWIIQMIWRVYLLYCPWSQHGILDNPSQKTSQCLCIIILPWGKYCYLHLPMGITCSQDIYQEKMSELFINMISIAHWLWRLTYLYFPWVSLTITYDNLETFSNSSITTTFKTMPKIKLLCIGDWILRFDTYQRPQLQKVNVILQIALPCNVKQVWSFISMLNHYKVMIPCCSHLPTPLMELTKKNVKF
jgi:hypothetical protein